MPSSVAPLLSGLIEVPPTERMLSWLGKAARSYREEADVVRSQIAGAVAVDQSTVVRFEAGESWPREVDQMLHAYAEFTGVEDPREIWTRALDLWTEERP